MYVIVWKYKVKPENCKKFEKAYGPEGSWANFFRKSEHYRGTCLFKSEKTSDAYLLLDFWSTKEACETFISQYNEKYQQLSHQLQDIYQEEAKVDACYAIH